jgi:hypothetical protein
MRTSTGSKGSERIINQQSFNHQAACLEEERLRHESGHPHAPAFSLFRTLRLMIERLMIDDCL